MWENMLQSSLRYFPVLLVFSSLTSYVMGSSEFYVQRMTQYDVNGVAHGCRASALSLEARSTSSWSHNGRHCVISRFEDITIEQFQEIRRKAGGLVLMLPKDISTMTKDQKEHLNYLEQAMLEESISIPVYFSTYNKEFESIVADITHVGSVANASKNDLNKAKRDSALSEAMNSISANGYQVSVSVGSSTKSKNNKIPIIQGELGSAKFAKVADNMESNSRVIVIYASLNTFGLYHDYPLNSDTAVLLTLADLFSKLNNVIDATPKYRVIFLLTESGPLLNFQGVKKWLDENTKLQNVDFVLCLDTVTQALNTEDGQLFMHVSKTPKENTPMSVFLNTLKDVATKQNNITVEGVHKKINLGDKQLAWPHERFSMKRLSAFTLSSLKNAKDITRTTIFKDNEQVLLSNLQAKVKNIAEALARYIYTSKVIKEDGQDFELFTGAMDVKNVPIKSYLNLRSALRNNDIKNAFEKYLVNIKRTHDQPDARDPDFMLYEGFEAKLNIYRIKPAVFDLILSLAITVYLFSVYYIIKFFPQVYQLVANLTAKSASDPNSPHLNHYAKTK